MQAIKKKEIPKKLHIGQSIYKKESFLAWLSFMIITLIFSLLLINKYFPITEGWLHDYSRYIDKGQFIYRDFYCPMAPGSIWVNFFICKITNYSFLAMRIFGIIERLCLLTIVFYLVSKIFSYKITTISIFTASIIYASTNTDVFYGYYQSALLFAIISLFFLVKMYENFDKNVYTFSIWFGIFAGLTFCFKQNTGGLFPTMIGIGYLILTLKKNIKKSILSILFSFFCAMGIISVLMIYLALNHALIPFWEQVIGGTSSKGSIISIFTSFVPRMINRNSLRIFAFCVVIFCLLKVCTYIVESNKQSKKIKQSIQICSDAIIIITSFILLYQYILEPFNLINWFANLQNLKYIYVILLIAFCILFCLVLNHNHYDNSTQLTLLYYVGLTLLFLIYFIYADLNQNITTDYNVIRTSRADLIYALFYFNFFYILYLVYNYFCHTESGIKILLYIASFSFMYIHGMSYIVEDHGTLLLFSLILGDILSYKLLLNIAKNILVYVFCLSMTFTIVIQRNNFTYNWWGVNTLPTSYSAQCTYKDPHLKGFLGEKNQVEIMNKIYDLLQTNRNNGDTLYTFPHLNYFNVMSNLDSPTFAKVHYFDVCADEQARKDAQILRESLPTFIIWQEFQEDEWATHEAIFRNGNLCGQREIQKTYKELTESGVYTLLGTYFIQESDPIFIWKKNK